MASAQKAAGIGAIGIGTGAANLINIKPDMGLLIKELARRGM